MAQQTIKEELEETLMKELISQFAPKLKKYVGPMSNKLKSFLKDKNKSLHIKLANDDIYLLVLDNAAITSFEVNKGGFDTYPVDKFIELLISGDLEALMAQE